MEVCAAGGEALWIEFLPLIACTCPAARRWVIAGDLGAFLKLVQIFWDLAVDRRVRKYEAGDLDAVLSAWEDASSVAHPFLSEEFLQQERYNIPNVYLPNTETWVVEQDEQVIGFISLIGNEIGAIFVRADFHGTGAGRALMEKAKQLRGDLEVEVFEANAIGRRFYSLCGFVPLSQSLHEQTGNQLLRLKFSADNAS